MTLQRVKESREFPGSEMSREKQDALAASISALEVFEAVIDNNARNVLRGVTGKQADFRKLASQGDELSPNQAAPLALGHIRKGNRQIAQADPPQPSVNRIDG